MTNTECDAEIVRLFAAGESILGIGLTISPYMHFAGRQEQDEIESAIRDELARLRAELARMTIVDRSTGSKMTQSAYDGEVSCHEVIEAELADANERLARIDAAWKKWQHLSHLLSDEVWMQACPGWKTDVLVDLWAAITDDARVCHRPMP